VSEIAVITGTTHGIGQVTSFELARAGRTVVMLCRNVPAAEAVRLAILAAHPRAAVHVVRCDLASLASVREAAVQVRRRFAPIGLLINNAGMASTRHRMSADGFELTFATNHLGPFLLTAALREHLDTGARIVNVASRIHFRARMDLGSVADARARDRGVAAYARSKLANVLHTFALARRLEGSSATANCLHPGIVATHLLPGWLRLVKPLVSPVTFDAERGARTTIHLALAPQIAAASGKYYDENQHEQPAAPLARSVELQEELWHASARWVGVPA